MTYIPRDQVPEHYPIKLGTLDYYRQIGKGPRWAKIGRRVFYRPEDIEEWIDAQFAQGGAA